jgi:thioredoxin-like negative regulator of GroEL
MATVGTPLGTPVAREPATKPRLIFFTSSLSGPCRRVEGFLAQVLQRRRNHGTFRVLVVDEDERPDLVSRFGVSRLPTLIVVEGRTERARIEQPRGCRDIEDLLGPWLR